MNAEKRVWKKLVLWEESQVAGDEWPQKGTKSHKEEKENGREYEDEKDAKAKP